MKFSTEHGRRRQLRVRRTAGPSAASEAEPVKNATRRPKMALNRHQVVGDADVQRSILVGGEDKDKERWQHSTIDSTDNRSSDKDRGSRGCRIGAQLIRDLRWGNTLLPVGQISLFWWPRLACVRLRTCKSTCAKNQNSLAVSI